MIATSQRDRIELVTGPESAQVYVSDLEQCVEYIKFMRETKDLGEEAEIVMPDDLREGKDRMIFGNIEAIYEWHRE